MTILSYITVALLSSLVTGVIFYWRQRRLEPKQVPSKNLAPGDVPVVDMVPWARVNEFVEHDRQRISRDLHDELGTLLSIIHLDLEIVMREAESFPPHIEAKLLTVKKNLNVTIETIRNIIWNLSPDFIESMSLGFALRELCHKLDALKGTHVYFVQSGMAAPLSQKQKLNLFRMVQELFANSIKHSSAWNISVQMHWEDSQLSLIVEDDGSGYRRKEYDEKTSGMGSINLIKRANSIGANVKTEELARGIRITIELKLTPSEEPQKEII
jgi:signal transduction histidine kinase